MDELQLNIGNIHSLEVLHLGRLTTDNTCADVISFSDLFNYSTHKDIGLSILLEVECSAVQ